MKKEGLNKTLPKLNKQQLGEAWKSVNWKKCQRHVDRLQRSIASAMERGDKKMVRKLQRILYQSESYNLICTRKVTQDNQGKRTAGVDGVKELSPTQRMESALDTKDGILRKWNPVRQKEIPKKNGKIRTLGIPTLKDRIYQAKLKGILEPCYEVIAEPNSYGFRPMRSTKDAIEQIFLAIRKKEEAWVLEGDLKGFFDNIKTEAIINNKVIKGNEEITATIKRLVKSGAITVNQEYIETDIGTPQGGVVSPLLANIAFNGLETMIDKWAWDNRKQTGQKKYREKIVHTVVYADDFVVIARERWIIEELKEVISKWCMEKMGVELSQEKTRITNTKNGFNFLGCNIKQYEINSTKSKTLIKPSKDSIKSIKTKIHKICKEYCGKSQDELIERLNPVLTGWGNYHKGNVAKEAFAAIDKYVFERTRKWAKKRHRIKGKIWIKDKYWHKEGNRNWVFKTENNTLKLLTDIKIKRHSKIKSEHQVFDGNNEYWTKRRLMNKAEKTKKERLMEKQKFKCNHCKELFKHDSVTEVDHVVPKVCGGKDEASNLQVLHRHCHDIKTRTDGSLDQRQHVKVITKKGRKPHTHCR
jgi:RNA-directed DNA polymerase